MRPPTNVTHLICKSTHHTGNHSTAQVLLKLTFTLYPGVPILQWPMIAHGALQIIPRILKIEVFKHGDAKRNDLYVHIQEDIEELSTFAAAVDLLANVDSS